MLSHCKLVLLKCDHNEVTVSALLQIVFCFIINYFSQENSGIVETGNKIAHVARYN